MKKLWKWLVGIFTFVIGILLLSGKKNKKVKEIKSKIKDNKKKTKSVDKNIAGAKETDEYLKKKRDAISKAVSGEKNEAMSLAKMMTRKRK